MKLKQSFLIGGAFLMLAGCQEQETKDAKSELEKGISSVKQDVEDAKNEAMTAVENDAAAQETKQEFQSFKTSTNEFLSDMGKLDDEFQAKYVKETNVDNAVEYANNTYIPALEKGIEKLKNMEVDAAPLQKVNESSQQYLEARLAAVKEEVQNAEQKGEKMASDASAELEKNDAFFNDMKQSLNQLASKLGLSEEK
ncbi:MAG: hypothetical protein ACI35R_17995 [Bacillus sp. (in: firmicutes)]